MRITKVGFPNWLLPFIMSVYGEALLHIWTTDRIVFGRFAAVLLFAMAFGTLLSLVCSFFPRKAGKSAAVVIGVVQLIIYFAEYMLHDAFQTFMSWATVQAGAGGVVSTYLSVVLTAIAKNWWRILLLAWPIVAVAVFTAQRRTKWSVRGIIAAASILLFLSAFGVVNAVGLDGAIFKQSYNFDSAVRSFGLSAGLCLEVVNDPSVVGNSELEFENLESHTEPTQQTVPVYDTQPTQIPEETTEPTEPPVVYEDHTLGLDFSVLAQEESNDSIAAMHSYVAGLTPDSENEYTGLFEGKNLIFITAEAFTGAVIDPELTPTLYRMATKGIEFTNYYQPVWGAGTVGGEYTNILGQIPIDAQCMHEAYQQNFFMAIGKQLQEKGYSSAAFHNNSYDYYARHETHIYLGYDYFMGYGSGMEEGIANTWPQSDLEMIDFTVPMYINQQPFSVYYMTVSGHSNYNQGGNAMCAKNYDKVAHLDCSEMIKCYIAANLELENALTSLIAQLEAAGIADDTVIVVAADHYPYGMEKSDMWDSDKDYLKELFGEEINDFVRDQNRLIIWSGAIEEMDLKVDKPTFSLDILPTLLNLFGLEYDSRLLTGRDVFSSDEGLVFWSNTGSWITDKGRYLHSTGEFIPADGVQVDEGYVERIKTIVRNKIKFSKGISYYDYFNYVYAALQAAETHG